MPRGSYDWENREPEVFVAGDMVAVDHRNTWTRSELLPVDRPTRRVVQLLTVDSRDTLTVVVPLFDFNGLSFAQLLFPDGILSWVRIDALHLLTDPSKDDR